MRRFSRLYDALDRTTSTNAKVAAMVDYFSATPPADAAWALYFLSGARPKRLVGPRTLVEWSMQEAKLPDWLLEECYANVGDLAETVALLLDSGRRESATDLPLHTWMEERLLPLRGLEPAEQRTRVVSYWSELSRSELYLLNKLLTGELRVGVSATLVQRALAQIAGVKPADIAHRMMGSWEPSPRFYEALVRPTPAGADRADEGAELPSAHDDATRLAELSRPYPFCLAYPLDFDPAELGALSDYQVEWKWDGIRAQVVRRGGQVFIWSRGEELVTDRFPEVRDSASRLPEGTVLDGEVMAFRDGAPLPFAVLQKRIGRQKLTPRILAEAPAAFIAYDLLELGTADLRARPLRERRALLESALFAHSAPDAFHLSPLLTTTDWALLAKERATSRSRNVEGLMLKRLDSAYGSGRKRGDWWKWKVDPYSIDAVLLYSQYGSGRRANLFTDHTFGVWDAEGRLVPVAKAYSGLTDEELNELDAWIRTHTLEKFGPVRSVEPSQVFELNFEAIAPSPRHKSGVAVRFPRIARWRRDKPAQESDTLESLQALIRLSRAEWRLEPSLTLDAPSDDTRDR